MSGRRGAFWYKKRYSDLTNRWHKTAGSAPDSVAKMGGYTPEQLSQIEGLLMQHNLAGKGIINHIDMAQLKQLGACLPPEDEERFLELLASG